MLEIGGRSLALLILLFFLYSFVGWFLETIWCSVPERRFVRRGFLYGPICPIYGVGALLIILVLSYFTFNIFLFVVASIVIMSAWEYFVGWFLETTTGIKYWDYSHHRFNIKGRVSLTNSLMWGVLAYGMIYWLNPPVESFIRSFTQLTQTVAAFVLVAVTAVDAAFTIRSLALMSKLMRMLSELNEEIREQLSLPDAAELRAELRERRERLLERAEHQSRRWRNSYPHLSSIRYAGALSDVRLSGQRLRERLDEAKEKAKAAAAKAAESVHDSCEELLENIDEAKEKAENAIKNRKDK